MPVRLYLDVHVDKAIHDQLRLRDVDVARAQDDGAGEMADEELLERAAVLGRLIFTQDIRFKAMAEQWQSLRGPLLWQPVGSHGRYLRERSGTDRKGH